MTTTPNVLATRYASAEMVELWSATTKVRLERQLWIAVLKAQRDLGVDVGDDVVEAYEGVSTRSTSARSTSARRRLDTTSRLASTSSAPSPDTSTSTRP